MREFDRVHQILKGIGRVAFNALAINNPNAVYDLITTWQHLDAPQAIHLQLDAGDTLLFSDSDLCILIRALTREWLAQSSHHSTSIFGS